VLLLADLEHAPILDIYSRGQLPLPNEYVETYLCPSDSTKVRAGSVTSYAANAGSGDTATKQKPANGASLNRIYQPKAAVMDGHWKDGRDHTLVFSERSDSMNYDIIGWNGLTSNPNDTAQDPVDHDLVDKSMQDRVWGPAIVWQKSPTNCSFINGPNCICPPADDYQSCKPVSGTGRYRGTDCTLRCNEADRWINAKPSSEHGGGVNVAFGSGRCTFLRDTIDYKVYRALMTLNEKESDSPDRTYLLDDSELQ
jgi:hypothetical protein